MENKKVVILAGILFCFAIVVSSVSATNYYNYVYNSTTWVPMLSTAGGQQKFWIEMKNCSYGNVQENLVVGKNFSVDTSDFFINSNTGNVGIGTASPGAKLEVTNSSAQTYLLNITNGASPFVYRADTGNVGIGTTNPGETLQVFKSGASKVLIGDTSDNGGNPSLYLTANNAGNAARFYFQRSGGSYNTYIGNWKTGSETYRLNLVAGGSTAVAIQPNGNIGIGTTSPGEKLEVKDGDIKINNSGTAILYLNDYATSEYTKLYQLSDDGNFVINRLGTGGEDIAIQPDGDVIIGTNGNVGIGTTSPDGQFHIEDSMTPTLLLGDSGATSNRQILRLSGGGNKMGFDGRNDDNTGDGDAGSIMIFDMSNGNVGIGTTEPILGKMQIQNDDTASNYRGLYIGNDDNDNWGLMIGGASTLGIALGTNTDDNCADSTGTAVCNLNDYAEMMEFSELPGDGELVIIDTENPGLLKVSGKPYDRLVAGVASEEPAMVIGSYGITIKGWDKNLTARISSDGTEYYTYPLAISGRKLIKVTDENGEVQPGDLLVTSSERGKAMRCDSYEKCQGAIIGKSMTSAGDNELVLALITLQ